MTSVGIEMSKGEVNNKLLNSLPYHWNSNCTTIKRTKDVYKTTQTVFWAYKFIKLYGKNNFGNNLGRKLGFDKSKLRCYNCDQPDHFTRECKLPKVVKEADKKPKENARAGASTSKALVTQETDSYDWIDQVQELEMTLSHAFMDEVDDKCNKDAWRRIDSLSSELEQAKAQLSKAKIRADKHEYSKTLNVTGSREKKEERSASRGTDCSTSHSKSHLVSIVDFVGRFESIKIQPNEMIKNFKIKFVKNDDLKNKIVLELDSSPLTEQVNQADSIIILEAGSKLNPNCEHYVPTGSLEQASTSSFSGLSDCDVKPFDPKEFHDKVCCCACGRPGHIARQCLLPTY
ncbi:hypothetical protein R6Q57_022709 [Mikania cordata]